MSPMELGVLVTIGLAVFLFRHPLRRAELWVMRRLGPPLLIAVAIAYLYTRREATDFDPIGLMIALALTVTVVSVVAGFATRKRFERRFSELLSRPSVPLEGTDLDLGGKTREVEALIAHIGALSEDERLTVLASARARGIGSAATGGTGRRYRKAEKALERACEEPALMRAAWATRQALDSEAGRAAGVPAFERIDFQLLAERAAQAVAARDRIEEDHFAILTAPFKEVLERRGVRLPGT